MTSDEQLLLIQIKGQWITDYIHYVMWGVITHTCPNFMTWTSSYMKLFRMDR